MNEEFKAPIFTKEMGRAFISQIYSRPEQFIGAESVVLDIETDKVILEITAPCHGTIKSLNVEQGDEVFSGQVLGEIDVDNNYVPKEKSVTESQSSPEEKVESEPLISGTMGIIIGFVLGVIVTAVVIGV